MRFVTTASDFVGTAVVLKAWYQEADRRAPAARLARFSAHSSPLKVDVKKCQYSKIALQIGLVTFFRRLPSTTAILIVPKASGLMS